MGKRKLELDENDRCLPYFYDLLRPPTMIQCERTLSALVQPLEGAVLMAIDTESKPTSRRSSRKTELLQISLRDGAYREDCFIIDLQTLSRDTRLMLRLNRLLEAKLADASCVKVGHGIANDFSEMLRSHESLTAFGRAQSLFDTNLVYRAMHPDQTTDVSLKFLTRSYLHFNLVKTQQLTDWSARPLTDSQIYYAACDSTVLLRLYDEMDFDFKKYQRGLIEEEPSPGLAALIVSKAEHAA